ncbi:MAG: cell envelope integrity protein CreD [Proteobacteria bacterium]|nr:cell envelope integrity protein CreD [Pseudomonadota bacterium]
MINDENGKTEIENKVKVNEPVNQITNPFLSSDTEKSNHSITKKIALIGAITTILMIPMYMVDGLKQEREQRSQEAITSIDRSWGRTNPQIVSPYLEIPYVVRKVVIEEKKESKKTEKSSEPAEAYVPKKTTHTNRYLLGVRPTTQNTRIGLDVAQKTRGIFKSNVFTANIQHNIRIQNSTFKDDLERVHGAGNFDILWSEAKIVLPVDDINQFSELPKVSCESASSQVSLKEDQGFEGKCKISSESMMQGIQVLVGMKIVGSQGLSMVPLAAGATFKLDANWTVPSFTGELLPLQHQISKEGMSAEWQSADFVLATSNIEYQIEKGSAWRKPKNVTTKMGTLTLKEGVSNYKMFDRIIKYGLFFIVISFASFLIAELTYRLQVSTLHYGLIGLANVVFFVLVLALSEHIAFETAYWIAAAGSVGLIVGYSKSVLGKVSISIMLSLIMLIQYLVAFLLLREEDFALLGGSIVIYVALAMVMWFTRKIKV